MVYYFVLWVFWFVFGFLGLFVRLFFNLLLNGQKQYLKGMEWGTILEMNCLSLNYCQLIPLIEVNYKGAGTEVL